MSRSRVRLIAKFSLSETIDISGARRTPSGPR